jgi:hypothetical protein
MKQAQAEQKLEITRIDFATTADLVVVNKLVEEPTRAWVFDSTQKPATELETMLAWCEANGWTVRRFLPLGARAWKGTAPRPIRTAGQIIKRRDELTRRPVPGLNVIALDLAYDC